MSLVRRRFALGWLVAAAAIVLSTVLAPSVFAGGVESKVGDVQVTMYAPSLIWGGTNAHVIFKLSNSGSKAVDVDALYKFPEGKDSQFTYGTKTPNAAPPEGVKQSLKELKPGESKYLTFTYIVPKLTAPLGNYSSNITLKAGEATQTIPWNFEVREGTRYQPQTDAIVMMIYAVSGGMLVFWFVYFMGFANKSYNPLTNKVK